MCSSDLLNKVVAGASGGTGGVRVEHHGFKAECLRGTHEHATQLAAAEHAERGGAAFNDLAGQKGQEGSRGHLGYFSDWTWAIGHGSWGGRLRACAKSAGRAGAARREAVQSLISKSSQKLDHAPNASDLHGCFG